MPDWLAVGVGGAFGAITRHYVGGAIIRASGAKFASTLVINIVGCLIIGFLAARKDPYSQTVFLFLFVGILGGFTTFSTFGLDTYTLMREHAWGAAATNVAVQVAGGVAAVWAGYRIGIFSGW